MPNPVMTAIKDMLKAIGCETFMITQRDEGLMLVTDNCIDPNAKEPRHVRAMKELGLYKGPHGSDFVFLENHPGINCGMYSCLVATGS